MRKDDKRRIAHEILIFMGLMVLLFLVLRLWPVVVLFILGIFAAALRLLFLSTKKVEVIEPAVVEQPQPEKPETEKDLLDTAFALLLRRITEDVGVRYPEARWTWENPNAKSSFSEGDPLTIILSGAGGYKKASVAVLNLQFRGLSFNGVEAAASEKNAAAKVKDDEPGQENAFLQTEKDEPEAEKPAESKINYERLAFEWIEDSVSDLMNRCNEANRKKQDHLLIGISELPMRESWPDIIKLLLSNGFSLAMETDEGIKVNLPQ